MADHPNDGDGHLIPAVFEIDTTVWHYSSAKQANVRYYDDNEWKADLLFLLHSIATQ